MPPIAKIGSVIEVTPSDEIQIVFGHGNHTFINDPTPFSIRVEGLIEQENQVVGVYGPVILGHERYRGLIASLLLRLDNSDWTRDNQSAAGFKVGKTPAKPNGKHPVCHPDGTDMDSFPYIVRFGSINSRAETEPIINSAQR